MKTIGTFESKRWGTVTVQRESYDSANGPTAITLFTGEGEPLGTLSVNMYRPECSHDSKDLPKDCLYVKEWGGNDTFAADALASGLFVLRSDLPRASSGYVTAPVWQLAAKAGAT